MSHEAQETPTDGHERHGQELNLGPSLVLAVTHERNEAHKAEAYDHCPVQYNRDPLSTGDR